MALVTIALPCHPPLEPLPPLTSAPSKHNGEGVLGVGRLVGGSAQGGHCPRQRPGVPLKPRRVICVDLGSKMSDTLSDSGVVSDDISCSEEETTF